MAATMLVAAPLLALGGVLHFLDNPAGNYACTSRGQKSLAQQEALVRAHLEDASTFEVVTYDCEDGSTAFLSFATDLDPAAARASFTSDSDCSLDPRDYGDPGVVCGTGSKMVSLFFSTANTGSTGGELYLGSG